MKLVPLEDRIVVRTAEAEETTVSGLVIPDTAKEKPQQGEVLAVGPGRRALIPPPDLCTDNAAMIAATAWRRLRRDGPTPLDDGAVPNLALPTD